MRFQQLTAPVTAKGVEDTAFYRSLRLAALNEVGGDPAQFGTSVEELHRQNARRAAHHPHAMLATATHDMKRGEDVPKIKAKLLYVLSRTDKIFPPSIAPDVMKALKDAGVDARYVEIDSEFGHSASGRDWAKWAPALRDFLAPLMPKLS